MNEHGAPSQEDLDRYVVLIRFLRQVHSSMQDINEEAESFNKLLGQQREVLNEHRLDVEDLTSAFSDYQNEMERVKNINLPERHNHQVPGQMTSVTADCHPRKAEV